MNLATLVQCALDEDRTDRDITVLATLPYSQTGEAHVVAKEGGVVSGTAVAEQVFTTVDPTTTCHWQVTDGATVAPGDTMLKLTGSLAAILTAERTALNFLQHLSGVASTTRSFVQAVDGSGCAIYDTRKTVPGLRALAKKAVVDGGGHNHRSDLAGGFLIKENHIAAAGSITTAVELCRQFDQSAWIEVECESLAQVEEAAALKPQLILLDNMPLKQVATASQMVADIEIEVSGGITLQSVRSYADCGISRIAVGAITHSSPALDLSLLLS
ncbi:MAG: carboxylating nicotinate-nucleotide diphosphorylase [Mariprofundales bacterium]|nr:carboxylating nicotinate-nucleotide diphosphorylase [Mariprofundales bacterium]